MSKENFVGSTVGVPDDYFVRLATNKSRVLIVCAEDSEQELLKQMKENTLEFDICFISPKFKDSNTTPVTEWCFLMGMYLTITNSTYSGYVKSVE
jgi:hypothetical protein